jgi:hypothetical protein
MRTSLAITRNGKDENDLIIYCIKKVELGEEKKQLGIPGMRARSLPP